MCQVSGLSPVRYVIWSCLAEIPECCFLCHKLLLPITSKTQINKHHFLLQCMWLTTFSWTWQFETEMLRDKSSAIKKKIQQNKKIEKLGFWQQKIIDFYPNEWFLRLFCKSIIIWNSSFTDWLGEQPREFAEIICPFLSYHW